jgi:uncharacterized protein YjiS (DUF1127 family)
MECSASPDGIGAKSCRVAALRAIVHRAGALLARWRRRARARQHLARLDEAALRDIGVTAAEAMRESNKPFWRA